MSVMLSRLENWIKDAMDKEGICKYKLDVSGNSIRGDGYFGEVTFVKVTTDSEKPKGEDIHLVVKSAKNSNGIRKHMPLKETYGREIFMYTKVFPAFREFQKECAIGTSFNKFPKCYTASNENKKEALIMENLKMAGFEIHERRRPQDLHHALFVFKNYGHLHAISLALRRRKSALFNALTKDMNDVMSTVLTQLRTIPIMAKEFEVVMEAFKNNGNGHLVAKYEGFKNGLEEYVTKYVDPENPQSVILHGDCWNNNMMFKYKDGNKNQPIDMRFIDFQVSRVASPVLDLSYYLYTCTDKSVLDHFDLLLQTYHTSLSHSLKDLGCNCDDILTSQQLKQQWAKYGRYGLALALLIVKLELCQADEVVDFAELAEKGEGFENVFNFKLQNQEEYEKRLMNVFSHFAEKFL